MMMFSLLLLLELSDPVTRITYDIQVVEAERSVSARMIIHMLDEGHFSVHSRKGAAGALFTYWATPDGDTLYLPKSGEAFVGKPGQRFRIFPDGPLLGREDWTRVLFGDLPDEVGDFVCSQDGDWRVLTSKTYVLEIRWRERKRQIKTSYGRQVLYPLLKKGVTVKPLGEGGVRWEWN